MTSSSQPCSKIISPFIIGQIIMDPEKETKGYFGGISLVNLFDFKKTIISCFKCGYDL